jgi:hypothetical protein
MFKIILVGLAIALRSRRKLALKNVAVHHQLETNSGPNFLHQTTSDPISPTPSAGRRGMIEQIHQRPVYDIIPP